MNRPEFETTRAVARRTHPGGGTRERAYLIGIAGEHAGRFFPLEGLREILIGRTEDCAVYIVFDDIVSRRHARLLAHEDGRYQLQDLDSLNGTLVNGREILRSAELQRGDRVFVGHQTIFKFDFLTDEERAQWESASVDSLTECYNRAFFDTRFTQLFEMATTQSLPLALLMVDIDHFKAINDRHGHQAGDFALHSLASLIDARLTARRSEAVTCRWGGEEFAILLPRNDAAACAEVAEVLRSAVHDASFEFEHLRIGVTVSLGGAALDRALHAKPADLFRQADANLYEAKNSGRNRAIVT